MKMDEKELYSRFSQYYVEMCDKLRSLEDEAHEEDKELGFVRPALSSEIFRHEVIVDILTQAGQERYNKAPNEVYKDGWDFWFKEDAEMRERKYGRNSL